MLWLNKTKRMQSLQETKRSRKRNKFIKSKEEDLKMIWKRELMITEIEIKIEKRKENMSNQIGLKASKKEILILVSKHMLSKLQGF